MHSLAIALHLQRAVGIDAATDGVNTHILQTIDIEIEIIDVKRYDTWRALW